MRILSRDYRTDIPYDQVIVKVKEGEQNNCIIDLENLSGASVYRCPGHFSRRQAENFVRALAAQYANGRKVCYLADILTYVWGSEDGYR